MEMPKNEPLLVKINPNGSVSTTAKNGYKKYEAVHIPPHGRLIDADDLANSITGAIYHSDLRDAPTIIPAEPLNEEVNE
jgi:hypothetical protein